MQGSYVDGFWKIRFWGGRGSALGCSADFRQVDGDCDRVGYEPPEWTFVIGDGKGGDGKGLEGVVVVTGRGHTAEEALADRMGYGDLPELSGRPYREMSECDPDCGLPWIIMEIAEDEVSRETLFEDPNLSNRRYVAIAFSDLPNRDLERKGIIGNGQ